MYHVLFSGSSTDLQLERINVDLNDATSLEGIDVRQLERRSTHRIDEAAVSTKRPCGNEPPENDQAWQS